MGGNQSEIIVGRQAVELCLRARKRRVERLYAYKQARDLDDILALAPGSSVEFVDKETLDRLADGASHQGVALRAAPLPILSLDEWMRKHEDQQNACMVMLDGVEDPRNFGAIVRSAAAFGAHGVLFAKDRAAPITPAAAKAAAGAMECIDLVLAVNLARALDALKKSGFWTTALDAAAEQPLWKIDLKGKIVLVVGSEGRGIRRLVKEKTDFLAAIPLQGEITSLNASVSAGIALMEWTRQQQAAATAR